MTDDKDNRKAVSDLMNAWDKALVERETKRGTAENVPTRDDTPAERTGEAHEIAGRWDSFLTPANEATDGEENYIQPNIEMELSAEKRNECRAILQEIKNFGTSQRQMLYLMYLMSLEFETVGVVRQLTSVIGKVRPDVRITLRDKLTSPVSTGKRLIVDDK